MKWKTKGKDDPYPADISIDGCTDNYCAVNRDQPASLTIRFASQYNTEKLTASIKAQVAGLWLPWKLGSQSNVCDNLIEGNCPVESGSGVRYRLNISIPRIAPIGTKTQVELRVQDDKKRTTVCLRVKVLVIA